MNNLLSAFSGFSTNDLSAAKDFYIGLLGLTQNNNDMGLDIRLPNDSHVFIYEKPDHVPATFTVLNFVVPNIDEAIDELSTKGIVFERYDLGNGAVQDEKGVLRGLDANMGPDIAWFKDPAGNVLSVIQDQK